MIKKYRNFKIKTKQLITLSTFLVFMIVLFWGDHRLYSVPVIFILYVALLLKNKRNKYVNSFMNNGLMSSIFIILSIVLMIYRILL